MSNLIYHIDKTQSEQEKTLCMMSLPHKKEFKIPYGESLSRLQELSKEGSIYFNQKKLVLDFYSKVEFLYLIEKNGDAFWLSAIYKYKEELISPTFTCPQFIISGITLRPLASPIRKELNRPISVTEIEEMQEDELPITFAENVYLPANDPLPVLILTDRVGASANLWMDYGNERICFHEPIQQKKRKLDVEKQWEKDLLETDFIRKQVGSSFYFCPVDKVAKSLTFLLEIGWKMIDWKGNHVLRCTDTKLEASLQNNKILVSGKLAYQDHQIDLSTVVGAFNRRQSFIQLTNDTVGLFPENAAYNFLAEDGEIVSDGIQYQKNRIGHLSDFLTSSTTPLPCLQNLKDKLRELESLEPAQPTQAFKGSLRPYQQQGVDWLNFLYKGGFHGILADEMGLGKTVQVLAFLSRLSLTPACLIILPTSLLFNWRKEIETFLPKTAVYVHHGITRKEELPTSGIILTSYTLLRLDVSLFTRCTFSCIVLDEAQAIKNENTQLSKTLLTLQADFRISLTGTPIENHLMELWSHFRFLMPDLLGDKETFQADMEAIDSDKRYLKKLQKLTKPFILRRKKEEVAKDLPEKIDQIVWVEMSEQQRHYYDTYLANVKSGLLQKVALDGIGKHRIEIFETLLRLRQICCHPWLVNTEMPCESSKLVQLIENLKEIVKEGRKALVYSQFTSMLSLVGKACKEQGWNYCYLDGQTSNREQVVKEFQTNHEIPFFLISLKAGGVGLNLTAADTVFIYDPWWNEAVEEQAIGRAHRIGQQKTVLTKRFIVLESVEEKILKLKQHKKQLVTSLFEDGEDAQRPWSLEDLQFMME